MSKGITPLPRQQALDQQNVMVWGVDSWDATKVWGPTDNTRTATTASSIDTTLIWGKHCWGTDRHIGW